MQLFVKGHAHLGSPRSAGPACLPSGDTMCLSHQQPVQVSLGKHQAPRFPTLLCQVQEHHLEIPEAISTWTEPAVGKCEEGGQGEGLELLVGIEVGSEEQ